MSWGCAGALFVEAVRGSAAAAAATAQRGRQLTRSARPLLAACRAATAAPGLPLGPPPTRRPSSRPAASSFPAAPSPRPSSPFSSPSPLPLPSHPLNSRPPLSPSPSSSSSPALSSSYPVSPSPSSSSSSSPALPPPPHLDLDAGGHRQDAGLGVAEVEGELAAADRRPVTRAHQLHALLKAVRHANHQVGCQGPGGFGVRGDEGGMREGGVRAAATRGEGAAARLAGCVGERAVRPAAVGRRSCLLQRLSSLYRPALLPPPAGSAPSRCLPRARRR